MGKIAPTFIAIMLALFSFTCLISYYYEAETAAMYLFQGESKAKVRKVVTWIMRIAMPVLIFIWGNLESDIAWNLSDLALGSCTWVNMLIVLLLSPKVIALYKDYEEQMKAKKDPYYNPDKISCRSSAGRTRIFSRAICSLSARSLLFISRSTSIGFL